MNIEDLIEQMICERIEMLMRMRPEEIRNKELDLHGTSPETDYARLDDDCCLPELHICSNLYIEYLMRYIIVIFVKNC